MSISISASGFNMLNRLAGIESGLDTETLIKGLTIMEENKVISAARQKQLLTWEKEFYREIMAKLNSFSSKYLSSGTSAIEGLFGKYKAVNTGSQYVTATPKTNSSTSNVVIKDIVSLATSSKLEGSSAVTKPLTITVDTESLGDLGGKSLKITLDGVEKTITFSPGTYTTAESVRQELQSRLDNAFGTNRIQVGIDGDTLTLNSIGNSVVIGKTEENDASEILGFTDGQSNMLNLNAKIADVNLKFSPGSSGSFKINGVEFNFDETTTIRNIMNKINSSSAGVTMTYSSLSDSFVLVSKNTGAGNQIALEDVSGSFLNSVFGSGNFTDGTNAVIRINTNAGTGDPDSLNYITVEKSSNTFEIDGISYTLLGKASGAEEENIRISTEYDIDGVAENIKQFVADYNDMLKTITDKLSEPKYKDFPPLTDEQRKELSNTEVALYDEKAKSGLLRNDSYLTSIATNLRNALFAEIKELSDNEQGIGFSLIDIGITTGLYSEKGQLKINEARLKAALSENPDKVQALFTQKSTVSYSPYTKNKDLIAKRYSESGLLYRISDIIQNNTRSITGSLTKLVGNSENDYSSFYAFKLRELDKKIELLQKKLKDKQEYYWMKFSKMESSLSTLNKQNAYLFNLNMQNY